MAPAMIILMSIMKFHFVRVSVSVISSDTTWRTDIKNGTIDHLLGVSATRGFVMQ